MATINAITATFPDANINGCLFHLVKNFRRKLSENGLIRRYNNDTLFALQARMIISLAFVPIYNIEEIFNQLNDVLPDELSVILDWFEDHYIGRLQR